jgi:GalNAc5-diNAcBac-PP-undecaprenol beta-1,3-glucosyltransferase
VDGAARADPRIRFFDNPKGPRHGELHRHAALEHARGRIVCYLADDDLWCDDHVAELEALLARADFASSVAVEVEPRGSLFPWLGALEAGAFRALMRAGINFLPLTAAGHTLAFYRALPHGWRTTPEATPTDLHMWQQLLAQPGVRVASGSRPTALRFGADARRGWTLDARGMELERWAQQLAARRWTDELEPLLGKRYAAAALRLRRRLASLGEEPGTLRRRIALELWKREARRARVPIPEP